MQSEGQTLSQRYRRGPLWDQRRCAALRAARNQLPPHELKHPEVQPIREDIGVGSKRARALVAAVLEAREREQ